MAPTARLVAVEEGEVCVDIGCFVGLGAKQMKSDDELKAAKYDLALLHASSSSGKILTIGASLIITLFSRYLILSGYGGPPPGGRGGGRGGRRGRGEGPPGVSLLVRNVSNDITSADIHQAFGRIGDIRDVYIPRDFHSQQPKGFAFVEYATHEQALDAREEMDRFVMKGRELEVVFAQEKRKTPDQMRGRVFSGAGGRRGGGGGADFDRSSSFERHMRRERMGGSPPR